MNEKYKNENDDKQKDEGFKEENISTEKFDENEKIEDKILDVEEDQQSIDTQKEENLEDTLHEEINQLRDEKLRLLAEMENLRKRTDKERLDSIRYGSMNLARDILSPDDNLTRALEAIPKEEQNTDTVNNLIDGLKMVQREFSSILEKHGIKKIKALETKFDHNLHQAMIEIESDEIEEGMVIQEMQSGYTMHDRLLRPSMVGVAKKNNKDTKNENKD